MTGIELDNPIGVGLKTTRGSSSSDFKRTRRRQDSRRVVGRTDLFLLPRSQEGIEESIGNSPCAGYGGQGKHDNGPYASPQFRKAARQAIRVTRRRGQGPKSS